MLKRVRTLSLNISLKRTAVLLSLFLTHQLSFSLPLEQTIPIHQESGYWVSSWSEVQIPEGLASFQILATGSPETFHQVTDLVDPSGAIFVKSDSSPRLTPYSQPVFKNVLSPNRSEAVVHGLGTLIVPNSAKLQPPIAGAWKIRFLSHKEPLEKAIHYRVLPKKFSDLNNTKLKTRVWIAPGSYWDNDAYKINDLLQETAKNFSSAGIELEVLSIKSLSKTITEPLNLPDDMEKIAFEQNALDAVNIYLMPPMEYQTKPINGLACIGGPGQINQRHDCFVALFAKPHAGSVELISQAKIVTHELGHYLGLFHTVDDSYPLIGKVFDTLDDTPEEVTGSNIMDPGIHHGVPTFSEEQKRMMKLSPALQ